MPEPTSTTAAVVSYAAASVTVPMLTAFGIPLGLRPEVLVAGFGGALAAIGFLNSVPRTGDTWRCMIRDTGSRLVFAVLSSLTAGYLAPLTFSMLPQQVQAFENAFLGVAFCVGGGARIILLSMLNRFGATPAQAGEGTQ